MLKKGKDIKHNAIRLGKAILDEEPDCFGQVEIKVSKALMADMTSNLKVSREYMRHMNIYLRAHGHKDEDDGYYWYSLVKDYCESHDDPSVIVFNMEDEYMSSY